MFDKKIPGSLQYSNTPILQYSNTPILQHSNTPILPRSPAPPLLTAEILDADVAVPGFGGWAGVDLQADDSVASDGGILLDVL
jgi:hypothetical protein